jgi:hypothetical protein
MKKVMLLAAGIILAVSVVGCTEKTTPGTPQNGAPDTAQTKATPTAKVPGAKSGDTKQSPETKPNPGG